MNVLGTGLSGLVGSRVVELLSPHVVFEDLSAKNIDITQNDAFLAALSASPAPWIFHFAAYTNVDQAEKDKLLGYDSMVWKVNVNATATLVDFCKKNNRKLLYISTDYVFDGTKQAYTETDTPNPQGYYAQTKYEGEKLVSQLGDNALIVRIANPYRAKTVGKEDFVHKIVSRLAKGEPVKAPGDQVFIPTYIDDIAWGIDTLVKQDCHGIYHLVGNDILSPYDAAMAIAQTFGCDASLVQKTTFDAFYQDRAPRPRFAHLLNTKAVEMGITFTPFHEGLTQIKTEMS